MHPRSVVQPAISGNVLESARQVASAMPSDLSVLLELQELDQRNDELTKEIENLPKHVEAIQSRLESHRQALAKTEETLAENGKERRQLEGQVGDHKIKISKLQDQMAGARTNAQYHAFQHEIQFCRDRIDECELQILETMEAAEILEANVAKAQAELQQEEAKVANDVSRANARIEADRRERTEKRAARNELTAEVPPPTMRTYERIRKASGRAVAGVVGEDCSACHVRVRPKFLQDLRHIDQGILTCESCGLILYIPDPPEEVAPADDPNPE